MLSDALMKKGLKQATAPPRVLICAQRCPDEEGIETISFQGARDVHRVLSDALMKKGLKRNRLAVERSHEVLSDALMKKGFKLSEGALSTLGLGTQRWPDEEGIET